VGGDNQTNTLRFENGARILFTAIEREEQLEFFQGQSIVMISVEEACQFGFINTMIDKLRGCLRSAAGVPCQMFLTCNPGGPGHCVPYGDVLTPDGWRDIKALRPGDIVYSVDGEDRLVEKRVTGTFASYYEGEMVYVDVRGLSMVCTPNHRVAKIGGSKGGSSPAEIIGEGDNAFSLVPFEDLPGQAYLKRTCSLFEGEEISVFTPTYFQTRKRKLSQPVSISGDEYCRFMGWFLSEGFCCEGKKPKDRMFGVCQNKEPQRLEIKALLDRLGFTYHESRDQFVISAPCWWNYLKQFGRCRDKFVPREIKNSTQRQMLIFVKSLMDGDGHWSKPLESGTYYTISRQLADDVSELLFKCGFVVYTSSRYREGREGLSYAVYFKPRPKTGGQELLTGNHIYDVASSTTRASNITRKEFSGGIYCIEVEDTHNFVLRQNGSVWVSGNSQVKQRFISPAPQGGVPLNDGGDMAVFIPSRVQDNSILMENDPKYMERLKSIKDPALRAAWLEGDWDVVLGGYFDDVWDASKHIVRDFAPPKHWPRICGMDWGTARPFSIGWYAVSDGEPVGSVHLPKGSLVRYDEWYGCVKGEPNTGLRLTSSQVAAELLVRESQRGESQLMFDRIADTSIFDQDDGPSIGERFAEAGVVWRKADKRRIPGWENMRNMLRGYEVVDAQGAKSYTPLFYVCQRCRYFIETVPSLERDEKNWDDLDSSGTDHIADECLHPGTFVLTDRGYRRISEMSESGFVVSPDGSLAAYSGCRITRRDASYVEVLFDDGTKIKCTTDHEILTSSGFVEAQRLTPGQKAYSVSQNHGGAIREESHVQTGRSSFLTCVRSFWDASISCAGSIIRTAPMFAAYTGWSGSTFPVSRSLRDTTFTMRTLTGPTTSMRTSFWLSGGSTTGFTCGCEQKTCLKKRRVRLRWLPGKLRGLGTLLQKGWSGIASIMKSALATPLLRGLKWSARTRSAGSCFRALMGQSSVPITASRSGVGTQALTMRTGPVRSAGRFFGSTVTPGLRRALEAAGARLSFGKVVSVRVIDERCDAWCLNVPSLESFIVQGGFVVHNCRYVLSSRFSSSLSYEDYLRKHNFQPGMELHDTGNDWDEITSQAMDADPHYGPAEF
jgi:hypothetical protein